MGSPQYRATQGALAFDAYYINEWGVINGPANCSTDASDRREFHKSRFTTVAATPGKSVVERQQGWRFDAKNRANPRTNKALKDTSNPVPASATDDVELQLFASNRTWDYARERTAKHEAWTDPVAVTLFHAVGHELNRHGLRSMIETGSGLQVVILVPGIEPDPKKNDPRYGLTVDDAQIKAALKDGFGMTVPHAVRVLAGFSTGSCGLNQCILNDLVNLSDVRRVVFFDCLYSKQCGDTAAALKRGKSRAGGALRIVVYRTSEAGNTFDKGNSQLEVVANNHGLIDSRGVIGNLYQQPRYQALIVHRALESAIRDGVVILDATQRKLFDNLSAVTSSLPRVTLVSRKETYAWVHGALPTGAVAYDDLAKAHAKVLDDFAKKLGHPSAKGTFRHTLWANRLPGWGGGFGEEKHDLFLPEFGWEYLLG